MRRTTLACLGLLLAGCSSVPQNATLATTTITNELGHVVGRRDVVHNQATRETWSNLVLYEPIIDSSGSIVAYQETVSDGTIRYALNGRKVGGRMKDLRSGTSLGVLVHRAE